jgi:hypothetical protein
VGIIWRPPDNPENDAAAGAGTEAAAEKNTKQLEVYAWLLSNATGTA